MMTTSDHCERVRNFSDHYFNKTLSENEQQEVDLHLAECQDCKSWFSFLKHIQEVGKSKVGKPKDNPFLYAALVEKIDRIGNLPKLSSMKISLAASVVVLLGFLLWLPFQNHSDSTTATVSSALVGASPNTHYLLSSLNENDMLFYWKTKALPIDQSRNEYIVYQQTPNSATISFTGNPCTTCLEDQLFENAVHSTLLPSNLKDTVRSVITSFAEKVRSSILVNKSGQLLVNSEMLGSVRLLEKQLRSKLSPTEFSRFKKQTFALIQVDKVKQNSSFTIHLPQYSDFVVISTQNKSEYALIKTDEFTIKSLRQSIAKLGRIIAPDFDKIPQENYLVVNQHVKLYDNELPPTLLADNLTVENKSALRTLSIIEANQFMLALKRGLTEQEEVFYRNQLAELFENYTKLSPEQRQEFAKNSTDEETEYSNPNSGNTSIVGFGTPEKSHQVQKKKSTVSVEHR